ncbi:iron transporter FeoA [Vallitalea longa]|uniref:Iron transporter FeoA n=1 Tax=Vallitalea longa TaxID=2936439 RepID=A0A9W5YDJ5_9FIRM|nr:FeoA family protein [Vallitalea longa]GKX30383.1 iron transporter FeoA [Vallitalea longa]
MILSKAKLNKEYTVNSISGKDDMVRFLFSLGCYEGEKVTIISKVATNYIINIKDSRYGIDEQLAKIIQVA